LIAFIFLAGQAAIAIRANKCNLVIRVSRCATRVIIPLVLEYLYELDHRCRLVADVF
jgi:hypothetical protein